MRPYDLPDETLRKIAMAFYRRARKWDEQLKGVSINHEEYYQDEIMIMQMGIALQWLELDGFSLINKDELKAQIIADLQKDFVLIPKGSALCIK